MRSTSSPITYADLTDIVFEGREHAYGAYALRKSYQKRLLLGTIIGLGLLSLAMALPNFHTKPPSASISKVVPHDTIIVILNPHQEEEEEKIIVKPPTIEPPKVRTVALLIPDPTPTEDLNVDTTMVDIKTLADVKHIGLENIDLDGEDLIDIPTGDELGEGTAVIESPAENRPSIDSFLSPSSRPEPVNMADIQQRILYHDLVREAGIEGTVMVRILIDKQGRYLDHKVTKSPHPLLSAEVEREVKHLIFTPALQGNHPILFWVNVPFRFRVIE